MVHIFGGFGVDSRPSNKLSVADAAGVVAMTAQRDFVRVLRGAVPRRDFHSGDTPPYALLSVQHHLSMPVAERAQCDGVLAAGRLRREGDAGHHCSTGVLRLHVTHRREHTSHLRVCPTHWLVRCQTRAMLSK